MSSKADVDNISGTGIVEFGIIGKYLQLVGGSYDAPKSFGYFLSFFSYNIAEAYIENISQGSQVVYAATDNPGGVNAFFYDSRMTQPVFGDNSGNWHGFRLITNPNSNYACTIDAYGNVSVD